MEPRTRTRRRCLPPHESPWSRHAGPGACLHGAESYPFPVRTIVGFLAGLLLVNLLLALSIRSCGQGETRRYLHLSQGTGELRGALEAWADEVHAAEDGSLEAHRGAVHALLQPANRGSILDLRAPEPASLDVAYRHFAQLDQDVRSPLEGRRR